MAKYIVKEKSFIGNSIVEAGTVVEYEGIPHGNLEPADKAAEKVKAEHSLSLINATDAQRRANAAQVGASLDAEGRALDADGNPLLLDGNGKPIEENTLV